MRLINTVFVNVCFVVSSAPVSHFTESPGEQSNRSTDSNITYTTATFETEQSENSHSSEALTSDNGGNDVTIIVSVLCVLTISVVALVVFRKPLLRKAKLIQWPGLRTDHNLSDGDRDNVSYSIAPGGVTYSLESLGGYTAETVLSG